MTTPLAPSPMSERLGIDYHWTPRQREVLTLIERGKNNVDIADALGISRDGVKYHVSEILSKLGADSREEAAEYWRRYNGMAPRFARVFRAIVGGTAMKVATGAAAIGVVGAGLVTLAVLMTPSDAKTADAPTLEAVSVNEVGLLSSGTAVVVNLRADTREQWVARFREFTLILADGTEVEGTTFEYWAHDPDSIHRTVVPSGGASVSVGFVLPGEWVEPTAILLPDGLTRIELPVASRLPAD